MKIFFPPFYNSTNTFPLEHIKLLIENDTKTTNELISKIKPLVKNCKSHEHYDLVKDTIRSAYGSMENNKRLLEQLAQINEKNITLVSKEEINDLIKENEEKLEKSKAALEDLRVNYPKEFQMNYFDIDQKIKDMLEKNYNIVSTLTELELENGLSTIAHHLPIAELIGFFNVVYRSRIRELESNLKLITRIAEFKQNR